MGVAPPPHGRTAIAARAHILVVDDEAPLRDLLTAALCRAGFAATAACCGEDALRAVGSSPPDLVLLDLVLPDLDGVAVRRRLSGDGARVPVILLIPSGDVAHRIRGLENRGQDCLVKPVVVEEVVARVRAVLRRTRPPAPARPMLRCADLEMDEDAREVRRAGRTVRLTPTEFALLRHLLGNAGRVLSRAQILDRVWHYDFGGDSGVVETYVSSLRRKVDRGAGPRLIHTVRGFGYVLRLPPR